MMMERKMMLVTEISTKQEFDEMKEIMEIFAVRGWVMQIATPLKRI
jgi:acetolactate synthase small subunit